MKIPFNVDHLKSLPAGDMNRVLLTCGSCESTAELVDLKQLAMPKRWTERLAHLVYQGPIPSFDQERKSAKQLTE